MHLSLALFFLSNESLVLAESSVKHGNVALSNLEEVLIWLVRAELSLETEVGLWSNSLNFWSNFEWIAYPLFRDFVVYLKESPVDLNSKWELIMDGNWL